MKRDTPTDDAEQLDPTTPPDSLVDRDQEHDKLINALTASGTQNAYLYGPRGTGKTVLARHTLDQLPDHRDIHYISCIHHDTQYKALQQLYKSVTGDTISDGHHTANLQRELTDHLGDTDAVIVLDELDFLLEHDGNTFLYYLSRFNHNLSIVAISSNNPDPASRIDERTYSSLHPRHITFDPYTQKQTHRILTDRIKDGLTQQAIRSEAVKLIASTTSNIRLAQHWLSYAVDTTADSVTKQHVKDIRSQAVQRYRDVLLKDFSIHHHILVETIDQLTYETGDSVTTGAIYERYTELCKVGQHDALTQRRISDFLTHLELLGIIDATHHHGGPQGKTRDIQLTQPLHEA